MQDLSVHTLLQSPMGGIHDVHCLGNCRHKSAAECVASTRIVFPYRGVYMRHVAGEDVVADANQVLFFNAGEEYRVSHPQAGGDACLSISLAEPLLHELTPQHMRKSSADPAFRGQRKRIDARTQVLVALLRHTLRNGIADTLEAETLMLTLVRRALGRENADDAAASHGRRRIVDRAKLVLMSDPARRWTLAEIAAETGGSPVYLTQLFQQVEGMPLYRYQLQLRLSRALDLIDQYDDLTTLGFDLGFSSHSHFGAAFRQMYGRSPGEFKQSTVRTGSRPRRPH